MKLFVIGATGPTGKELLKLSLAQGHEVTALVRNPEVLPSQAANLRVLRGNILNLGEVEAAITGTDAVVCSLGRGITFKHVTLFSDGTRNLIGAMNAHGIRRLLCITGIGAGDSRGHGGFVYDNLIQPVLLRTIYQDKERQEELLRNSHLDWIIIRPGALTNGPATGSYKVLLDLKGVTSRSISRADVADFALKHLTDATYLHQTPLITN